MIVSGIKKVLFIFGRLFYSIFSPSLIEYFFLARNIFYSGWVSRRFKSFGKNSIVSPLKLIGALDISIGDNCSIGGNSVLSAWRFHNNIRFNPQIIIGNFVSIGSFCHISAINKIYIGDNVLTGKFVTITDNSHGKFIPEELILAPHVRKLNSNGPVIISNGVWIGDKVTILPNVLIGENSIIASNSVVTKNIPENCIAGGIPAIIIKRL